MKLPDVVAKFADAGAEARTSTLEDMGRLLSNDKLAWQRLISEAKISVQ